ncbi:PAS domain-containing protein [Synechococcus sp. MIT S9504]|uniref:PAS domain-containing protein n=1 Tax=Synechococcus sp. MIT S9504 TaxID=1801628 RepID=UPI0007BB7290|nr:PAS domain-containing protein [Synechococcus sp. MIT S9504]KZR85271.1 PAS fold protein [Synechococcus sp. MIT S9504]
MENLLSLVVNATDNCIYVKDRDLRFLFVNSAVSRLYEADAESMIGKSDIDFIAPEQSALFNEADRRVIDSGVKECFRFEIEIKGVIYIAEDHKFPVMIDGSRCVAGIGVLTPKAG